jgi:hypothetical protein
MAWRRGARAGSTCDGAVARLLSVLRRPSSGKVFPSGMRGARGWHHATRRVAELTVRSGQRQGGMAAEKRRCPIFDGGFGGRRRWRREPAAPMRGREMRHVGNWMEEGQRHNSPREGFGDGGSSFNPGGFGGLW